MAPSTLSLFLTVLVFAGAQGAEKDLDQTCDPDADTCINNATSTVGLACDTLARPNRCKIKVDQACSAAKCVTGAACVSKLCKCGEGYAATAVKTCAEIAADTFGGACIGGPDAKGSCTDANALCSADSGFCACKTGYTGTTGAGCNNGAKAAFASVTSLVLACIVCLLAIN